MKLNEIIKTLDLTVLTGEGSLDREVRGGYVGDLLSDVLANAEEGDLWITIQIHQNVVPVAVMKGCAAIVIAMGKEPDPATLERAGEEGLAVLGTALSSFEAGGRLHALDLHR